ncbi:MAG: Glyoxylate reductase [Candidatus Bathyarchaeota archaeon BA2]|nr:MAG: Glyoxylate reductase [Candidatus Bathyarchaeota archaeon BA2]
MNKHKILVADDYGKKFYDELARYGEVVKATDVDDDIQLDDVTMLVVRSKTKVNEELVNRMRNLKCVITATHGIDHVDVNCLKEKGIEFYNIPVQSYDIAQGVIAYILAHSTNLVEGDRSMKRGEWKKKKLMGCRIKGKTLGIIGYGRIGKEVARMASALEMNVVVYDPYVKSEIAVTLNELLEASDFITIHVPLTEKTKHMIGKNEISKMKDGAHLINTSRGGVIDEEALLDALHRGKLSGVALDVYEHHPPFENKLSNRLIKDKRVIATPHSIGQTIEAIEEKGEGVLKIIKDYIRRRHSLKIV